MELNISDIIFSAINFAVMAGILTVLLYKPVICILDARKERIESKTAETAALLAEANEARERSEQELAETREKVTKLLQKAEHDSEARKTLLIDEAKKQSEQLYRNVQSDIVLEKEKAKKELKTEAVILAADIARKLMTPTVPVSSINRIEEFVEQLSKPETYKSIENKISESGPSVTVEIVSVHSLTDHERKQISDFFSAPDISDVIIVEAVDPELISGSVLCIGDLRIDGSVFRQLNMISSELISK